MEGYDEEQTEYSLNTKLLADGSDFPVVPNGQARREHHKGESFLPPPHMMTAGAQEKVLAKGRTSNPSPPEDSYSLAGESSYMFTFLMWFMFVAHAGCMTYALTADWSLTEILVLQTPSDPTCPTGGDWDSSLSVCRMEMFTSTYQSNVNVSKERENAPAVNGRQWTLMLANERECTPTHHPDPLASNSGTAMRRVRRASWSLPA
mmetsp:Transcript_64231/g.177645  ORF Transcript_64231/g.177645 Transcript_64231/m.177645 type:complete len:205 (-) Transcript_64231:1057-1671(-)